MKKEMLGRARALIPSDRYGRGAALAFAIAFGPAQTILRPSDLERPALQEELEKAARYGNAAILDRRKGIDIGFEDDRLVLNQEREALLAVEGQGDCLVHLRLPAQDGFGMVVLEEDVKLLLHRCFQYAAWLIDRIDPTVRTTHFAVVVALTGMEHQTMRTRAQQAASPNRYPMRSSDELPVVDLKPPHRPRAMLKTSTDEIVEDILVLLRRRLQVR